MLFILQVSILSEQIIFFFYCIKNLFLSSLFAMKWTLREKENDSSYSDARLASRLGTDHFVVVE